jgi:hypothetical protein
MGEHSFRSKITIRFFPPMTEHGGYTGTGLFVSCSVPPMDKFSSDFPIGLTKTFLKTALQEEILINQSSTNRRNTA